MKKLGILFLLAFFVTNCSGDMEPETSLFEPAPADATSTAPPTFPAMDAPTFDKILLWTNGTQLRGANIYMRRVYPELDGPKFMGAGATGPPYTQADFDALAATGANYANFSVPGLFTVHPPYIVDEGVQAALDELLAMAEKADLFVVISVRAGPGRSEFSILRDGAGIWFDEELLIESVWEDETARAAWAEMWQYTAERYRDHSIIVGYDLMVEPNALEIVGSWDEDEFYAEYGNTGYDWNFWFPDIVDAIREVDQETPLLIGSEFYSSVELLPSLKVVDDERTVYIFHQYAPYVYTHQDADDEMNVYPGYFDANWDEEPEDVNRAWLEEKFSFADDFSAEHGVPLAVNESGVVRWVPGADIFMRDTWDLFEARGINYAVWMWYPDWEPMAEEDDTFNFHFGPDPHNFSNVPNALQNVYESFWARNTIRPSDFE